VDKYAVAKIMNALQKDAPQNLAVRIPYFWGFPSKTDLSAPPKEYDLLFDSPFNPLPP
jgi:hypothetical protein